MSANYFDRLEAELRAAVPRAAAGIASPSRARRPWPRPRGLALALSLAVTAAVVVGGIALLGHRHAPARPPVLHHRGGPGPGGFQYPLGAVPTRAQLLANFAVLRRSQMPADHTWHPQCDCAGSARQLDHLTRFVGALPSGYRLFLDVEQFTVGGQLNMATGSYVLNVDVVDPHGSTSSSAFGPNTGFTVFPISSGGNDAVWVSVIPDGVATVRWTFGCQGGRDAGSPCAGVPTRTFTVPVVNNAAVRQIPNAGNCGSCAGPLHITWLSGDGRTVTSFTRSTNLVAPPFVKGGRGSRTLHALLPTSVGSVRLGEASSQAADTLKVMLGPAADLHVPTGGCGIDHESAWTSPAVAQPLTVYERRGRFVGYQYGAPVNEIGLQRGPGAALTTRRGLILGDTIGVARRLYGSALITHASHGTGTWQATADGGTLRGSVLPVSYPLRIVKATNPVASIRAGLTGCLARGG
jgi:hypothetical protein